MLPLLVGLRRVEEILYLFANVAATWAFSALLAPPALLRLVIDEQIDAP